MNDEKLIELVRSHNVLYDLSNPKYMDTEFKNAIWAKIGEEVESSGQTCKTRWANIRDNFRKSLKKNKTTSGQKAKSVKIYKYAEQLNFLKDFFNERETKTNIGDDIRSQDLSEDETPNKPPEDNGSSQQTAVSSCSVAVQQTATEQESSAIEMPQRCAPTQQKRRKQSSHGKIIPKTAAATVMEYLIKEKENPSSITTQAPDAVDAFLSGIAPVLKKLPPRDWHFAKAEMFAVVQKYELKMLTEGEQSERLSSHSHLSTPTPSYSEMHSPVEGYNQSDTEHFNLGQSSTSDYSVQQYFRNYQ